MNQIMIASLQAKLLKTDLEDFAEHFEEFITHPSLRQFFRVEWGAVLFDRVTFDDEIGFQPQPLSDEEGEYVGNRGYTRIFVRKKRTRLECLIYVFPKNADPAYASLDIARYQQDELIMVAYDFYNWGFVEQLKEWLEERWGKQFEIKDAPQDARREKASGSDDMPLLPNRATDKQWDEWFDWYYRNQNLWGPQPNKIEHMATLILKGVSTIKKKHADYTTVYRSL